MTAPHSKYHLSNLSWLVKSVQTLTDDCLIWPFKKDNNGYGRLRIPASVLGESGKIVTTAAHRYAFKLIHGRFPSPHGLHKCDTPACVNPRHIFEGSYAENVADMVRKNRQSKGSRFAHAKLTEADIIEIRLLLSSGWLQKDVADLYSVSHSRISYIHTRKNWKHVG
jgi:hypothetical protein